MKVEKVPAHSLFVTPEFRESDWVQGICERAGDVWVTRDELLPGHFGTFFGATGIRHYENKHIQDLYYLHELTHVTTLLPHPGDDYDAWTKRMNDSEFVSSLTSECFAHMRIRGLREQTFTHRIWVDRFLKDRDFDREISHDPSGGYLRAEQRIMAERNRALNAPERNDFVEQQIHNYGQQNWKWCGVWAKKMEEGPFNGMRAYQVVEQHMASPDRDATHQEWLDSVSSIYAVGTSMTMPFYAQAKAFALVYAESNASYGNWLMEE